jgi:hypothetical protein
MAKKIQIDIEVNGKMQKATVEAGKLRKQLDGVSKGQDKVSKSARTVDRNLKGAAQASSNSTKNFSKMAQGITGGLVPAYATLAANLFAVSAAFQFLKNASQTERLKQAQMEYAASTGNALGYLSSQLQKASEGMLSFSEASAASAIGAAKGFSAKQMQELAVSAGRVSKVLGRDFTDAFDRLVRGVSKAEPELLDELGVTLRLEKAKKNYADALGIAVGAMSDFQISQSVLLETQRQINKQFGDIEPDADPFVKLSKTFDDLIQKISSGILPAFQSIATAINNNAELALGAFAGFSMMILKSIIPMDTLKESMDEWGTKTKQNYKEAGVALETYKNKLLRSKMTSAEFKVEGYGVAQGLAQQSPLAGKKGEAKFMKQLRLEADLTKREMARMSQAIAGALKNIDKQGMVTSGAFKGMTKQMVLDMQEANLKIKNQWALTDSKLQATFKSIEYKAKIGAAAVAMYWQAAAKKVVAAVTFATRGFNILLRVVTALFSAKFFLELLDDIKILGLNIIKVFSNVIEFVTGWNPFGNWSDDKIKQIKEDMKFNEELQEMKDNFTSTIDAIIKQIDAATSKGLNFRKMVNTLSQVDILGVKDQMTALEEKINERMGNKGFFDKIWEKFVPDEQLKELEEELGKLETKLKKLVPKGLQGDKELVSFIESTKEVAAVQQEFKNAQTAVSNASSEGNIRNMADAQAKANAVYDKAVHTLTNYYKTLEKGGAEQNILEGVIVDIDQLNIQKEDIFGGVDLVSIVKEFNEEQERINNKLAENQVGKNLLKISGLNKLIIEQELEQLAISDKQAKIDQARLEFQEQVEAMARRPAKENTPAKQTADKLRKQELQNRIKVLESEQQVLWYKQEINEEVRKQQAIVNNLSSDNRILDKQKELLNLEQKRVDLLNQQRAATETLINLELEKAVRQAQGPFNAASGVRIAGLEYAAQQQLIAIKEKSVQDEFAMKSRQIDLEYDLLEAKQKLLLAELKRDKIKPENIGFEASFEEQIDLVNKTLDALPQMRQLNSQTLDLQKKAAMAEIKAQKSRAAQNLEDAYAIKQLTTEFAGTFRSELAGFLDEWDWGDSDKGFKELAVEFGNGIMQSVKSKANELLAEYITDWLFSGNTTAAKVLGAHMEGATVVATAIDAAFGRAAVTLGVSSVGSAAGGMLADGVKSISSADFTPEGNVDWKKMGGAQYASYDGVGVENPNYNPASDTSGGIWETMKQGASDLWTTVSGFFMKMFAPIQAATVANTAATAADTAAKNANTIAAQANTLAKQTETTTTVAATAADSTSATVTATETAAKVANTATTATDTIATGVHSTAVNADTTATAASAATKSASSGPFSWIASLFGAKNGGVMTDSGRMVKGYAAGGIASGPRSGFPAILHGREAVVPLPNGRSIPVDMPKGAAGMQNNTVTVNVTNNSDGSSRSEVESSMGDETMGKAIAAAVQKEIINQKRAGGMLR